MIIDCGERRLKSYRYGWMIEKLHTKESGEEVWIEDSPAFPKDLTQGLQMVGERILCETGTVTPVQLLDELLAASRAVRCSVLMAGSSAKRLSELRYVK